MLPKIFARNNKCIQMECRWSQPAFTIHFFIIHYLLALCKLYYCNFHYYELSENSWDIQLMFSCMELVTGECWYLFNNCLFILLSVISFYGGFCDILWQWGLAVGFVVVVVVFLCLVHKLYNKLQSFVHRKNKKMLIFRYQSIYFTQRVRVFNSMSS